MDNVEASNVPLTVHNDTRTTHVTTTSDHDNVTSIELDKVGNLALLEIVFDGVVNLDAGVGVTDSTSIVSDNIGNTLRANSKLLHLAELVSRLLRGDAVDRETALHVVKETEVLARLLEGDNIHEASGEGRVGADLVVDLDNALLDDGSDLAAGKGILKAVAEEDGEREGLAQLVRTGRGAGSVSAAELVKHP